MLPNPYVIIGALLGTALLLAGAFFYGKHVQYVEDALVIEQQKKEAATTLANETAKVLAAERRNRELAAQLDRQREEQRDELDRAYDRARRDAAAAGGLRDPGRRPSGCRPVPATSTAPGVPDEGPARGTALSSEAEQFLFEFAREADQLILDFRACREHALRGPQ